MLKVVKDDGTAATTSRNLIIKDAPKKLVVQASVKSAKAGFGVDFSSFGTVGQIESYEWNFGAGTSLENEATPTHVFVSPGTFPVKLTVTFADGTVRTAEMEMVVE